VPAPPPAADVQGTKGDSPQQEEAAKVTEDAEDTEEEEQEEEATEQAGCWWLKTAEEKAGCRWLEKTEEEPPAAAGHLNAEMVMGDAKKTFYEDYFHRSPRSEGHYKGGEELFWPGPSNQQFLN